MKQFKKVLCILLILCIMIPMTSIFVSASSYASGAGNITDNPSYGNDGVYYTFENITPGTAYYTQEVFVAENGIEIINVSNGYAFANDSEGNLVISNPKGKDYMMLQLKAGTFGYPYESGSNFNYITHLMIRYKVLDNTEDFQGTDKSITVYTSNSAGTNTGINNSFIIPENGEWIETVLALDATVTHWNNSKSPYFLFPQIAENASIVIDYIGIYQSKASAEAAIAEINKAKEQPAVKYYGAQAKADGTNGVRFIGTIDQYDNEMYEEIGFKLTANGKAADNIKITTVFSTIIADGEEISAADDQTLPNGATYFTYSLNSIPQTEPITFTVTVYVKIGGVEVCGETYSFVYNSAAAQSIVYN